MTIEETLRKLIHEKYIKLSDRIRDKATHKRIYPDSIADYYEDYYQALEDALRALVGADAVKGFNAYYKELETALINEAKTLQRAYDIKAAREHLERLCSWCNPRLENLLSVVSDDDLLLLEKESDYPDPDMWTDFDIFIDKMCGKYSIPVPCDPVIPAEPVQEKPKRTRRNRKTAPETTSSAALPNKFKFK